MAAAAAAFRIRSKRRSKDLIGGIDFERLCAPFQGTSIKYRLSEWSVTFDDQGRPEGRILSYLDARDIQKRLDEVVGPAHWSLTHERFEGGCIARLGLKINGEWVFKSDLAPDSEEGAMKGSASRALCRAASAWGIGRYLYDTPPLWAEFSDHPSPGFMMADIDGEVLYWRPRIERADPKPASLIAPPVTQVSPSVAQISPSAPKAPETQALGMSVTPASRRISRPLVKSAVATRQIDPSAYTIPFRRGEFAGRRFSELNEEQMTRLKAFVGQPNARGILSECREMLNRYLLQPGQTLRS